MAEPSRTAEADDAAPPAEGASKPAEGASKPAEGASKPAEGASKPAEGAAPPAEGASKPAAKLRGKAAAVPRLSSSDGRARLGSGVGIRVELDTSPRFGVPKTAPSHPPPQQLRGGVTVDAGGTAVSTAGGTAVHGSGGQPSGGSASGVKKRRHSGSVSGGSGGIAGAHHGAQRTSTTLQDVFSHLKRTTARVAAEASSQASQ
jgi:hypothetical protein